nr:immunoglobulin heavy chain junction region [Mus musculus]NSM06902.1 immunoglobulin heavy chain junction region [Mus musculus]
CARGYYGNSYYFDYW